LRISASGKVHEIKNTSKTIELKLYTIYAPPEHRPNLIVKMNPDKNKK
jgi:hypothetical protein